MPRNPAQTSVVTISLPVPMAKQIERQRKIEQRSRSELVREALRIYFARAAAFPEVVATPAEIRALKRARRNYLAGKTITYDEYRAKRAARLEAPRGRRRTKTAR